MGLFRKNKTPHEEKVEYAYKCYKSDYVETVFPGGQKQIDNVIKSIATLCDIDLSRCSNEDYHNITSIFADIFIRKGIAKSNDDIIRTSLLVKHKDLVKSDEVAEKLIHYYGYIKGKVKGDLSDPKEMQQFEKWIKGKKSALIALEMLKRNTAIRNNGVDRDDFGLVKTNPMYTVGPDGTAYILNRFRTEEGKSIVWRRINKEKVEGLEGKVCTYEIYNEANEYIGHVFVNMRSLELSSRVPNGYLVAPDIEMSDETRKDIFSTMVNRSMLAASMNYYDSKEIEDGLIAAQKGIPLEPKADD